MEQEMDERIERPIHTNTFALPNDKGLLLAHKVHSPSIETLKLKSEQGREIFAEAFIEHPNLGTLADLCVRALARAYGISVLPFLMKDPLKIRILYDSIDVDSPLDQIYTIEDRRFWKRVVLEKTSDKTLKFQDDSFHWKNLGISLKYTEMVEECQAEYWPEQKMEDLAVLVKDFVKEIHIKKLQSLKDCVFDRYLLRDSDTDKSDSTDVSSTTEEEPSLQFDEEGEEEEDEEQIGIDVNKITSRGSSEGEDERDKLLTKKTSEEMAKLQLLQAEWNVFEVMRAEKKIKVTEERRDARRARREAQQRRRDRREEKQQLRREKENQPKLKTIVVKNVYDLPIVEIDDEERKIIDKRNPEKVLAQRKNYKFPPEHCHHVDLKFLRLFEDLEEFSIVFHPPPLADKYHTRHFNFSYDDIDRLAIGISTLEKLRIFRLRHSRMDERKLLMLTAVLKNMNVEVVDFGYDQLTDDCDDALYELFRNTTTIKSLELEGNYLKINSMRRLTMAMSEYNGILEYLGLARNPLNYEALHMICKILPYTHQIHHLCLSGIQLTRMSLRCCIANELLRRHKALRKLDLVGCNILPREGEEIVQALQGNVEIEYVDCRGCNLPLELEYEIEVCVRRNRYVVENPYIGDETKTEAEIKEFVRRQKNPLLLKLLDDLNRQRTCLENRPDIAERFSALSIMSGEVRRSPSVSSFAFDQIGVTTETEAETERDSKKESFVPPLDEPFVFKPNEFNYDQFHAQVYIPGPGQRYFYFKARKERTMCSRDDEN